MKFPGHRLALALAAGVMALWLAAMAATIEAARLPDEATGTLLAVFTPATGEADAMAKIIAAGASPIRRSWIGFVWVVHDDAPGLAGRLAAQGAIGAWRELPVSPELAGCVAYADAKMAELFSLR